MASPNDNYVPRVPEAEPRRLGQFVDRVATVFNDLLRRGDITRDNQNRFQLAGGGGGGSGGGGNETSGFRLTASSTEPVPTGDLTAESTLYLSPYAGNGIALYTGTAWVVRTSPQVSIDLSGLLTTDKNFDVFAAWTGSAVELSLSAAWANDSTRTDAVTQLDGVWVLSGDHGKRLVGTVRATSGSEVEDSLTKRYVWNADNRVRRPLRYLASGGTHTYTIATWRPTNANNAAGVGCVCGAVGGAVNLTVVQISDNAGNGGRWVGVGVNSLAANSAQLITAPHVAGNGYSFAWYDATPAVGFTQYTWLEISAASGTTTWIDSYSAEVDEAFGMRGFVDC